jgi:hypothetical protein
MVALLVLGGLLLITMGTALPIMRPRRNGHALKAHRLRGLMGYRLREEGIGSVLLAALAAATIAELYEPAGTFALVLVAAAAALAALVPGVAWLDILGALGAFALLAEIVLQGPCGGGSRILFFVGVAVAGVAMFGAAAFAFLRIGRRRVPVLLAFALLDMLRFVVAPGGLAWSADDGLARGIAAVVAVVVVGALAGIAPRLVTELVGVALVVTEVWLTVALPGATCDGSGPAQLFLGAIFLAVYLGLDRLRR